MSKTHTSILRQAQRPRTWVARCALAVLAALLFASVPSPASAATLVPDGSLVDVGSLGDGFTATQLGDLADQQPRVVMDDSGGFIVFWRQAKSDPDQPTLVGRRFNADGTAVWVTRPFWNPVTGGGPVGGLDDVAMNGAGDFVIAWLDPVDGLLLRAFDNCGDPLDAAIEVGIGSVPDGQEVVGLKATAVGISDDRELVVAYVQELSSLEDPSAETFDRMIVRRYDVAGDLLGPEAIATSAALIPRVSVAVAEDGSFAVAAEQVSSNSATFFITIEAFDATGDRIVTPPPQGTHPTEFVPDLAMDGGGALLLAFEDAGADDPDGLDGSCTGVFARFSQGGSRLRGEARVDPATAGCQMDPRAAGLDDGWLVAWRGADANAAFGSDGSNFGIHVRQYDGSGDEANDGLRLLPGSTGGFDLAAGEKHGAVAAILARGPGAAPRVTVQRLGPASEVACVGGDANDHMCFQGDRFRVDADWRDPYNPRTGLATTFDLPDVDDSEAFWFFRDSNLELLVKVLNGTPVNGHYWVFYGSLSTVEFWMTVTDTTTGEQNLYHNPPFVQASRADTAAFDSTSPAGGAPATFGGAAVPSAFGDLAGNGAYTGVLSVPAGELAGSVAAPLTPPFCGLTETQLCFKDQFGVTVSWRNPRNGQEGVGRSIPLTDDTGAFWFFNEDNAELMIKVLDGRAINGHWWVFYAGLSDVEYTITVTHPFGEPVTYSNEPFELRSNADTEAIEDN